MVLLWSTTGETEMYVRTFKIFAGFRLGLCEHHRLMAN